MGDATTSSWGIFFFLYFCFSLSSSFRPTFHWLRATRRRAFARARRGRASGPRARRLFATGDIQSAKRRAPLRRAVAKTSRRPCQVLPSAVRNRRRRRCRKRCPEKKVCCARPTERRNDEKLCRCCRHRLRSRPGRGSRLNRVILRRNPIPYMFSACHLCSS